MRIKLYIGDSFWQEIEYPNWHPDPKMNRGLIHQVEWGLYGKMVLFFIQDEEDIKRYRLVKTVPEGEVSNYYKKYFFSLGTNYEKKLKGEIENA